MKTTFFSLIVLAALPVLSEAQSDSIFQKAADSVNASMHYQTGTIQLKAGIAKISVPEGFKYLDAAQSNYVLTDLWGNPRSETTLGMLFPENLGPMSMGGWAFNIEYEEIGYVEDDDADEIDYKELLVELQQETAEGNKERVKQGYPAVEFIGWASDPYYDKDNKVLHWAKEVKFGDNDINTLNYNVRLLGRKGVMVLNAIATPNELEEVKKRIPHIVKGFEYLEGNKYTDFDPKVDEVAAWTLGSLVAGKVLAKVGFFALIAKFWKLILLGIAGAGGTIWKNFKGRKKESFDQENDQPAA